MADLYIFTVHKLKCALSYKCTCTQLQTTPTSAPYLQHLSADSHTEPSTMSVFDERCLINFRIFPPTGIFREFSLSHISGISKVYHKPHWLTIIWRRAGGPYSLCLSLSNAALLIPGFFPNRDFSGIFSIRTSISETSLGDNYIETGGGGGFPVMLENESKHGCAQRLGLKRGQNLLQ